LHPVFYLSEFKQLKIIVYVKTIYLMLLNALLFLFTVVVVVIHLLCVLYLLAWCDCACVCASVCWWIDTAVGLWLVPMFVIMLHTSWLLMNWV